MSMLSSEVVARAKSLVNQNVLDKLDEVGEKRLRLIISGFLHILSEKITD